jgi:hypothetical protein
MATQIPGIEQELSDACAAMEQARASSECNDVAMVTTALKDVRKRVNRLLRVIDGARPVTIDPDLPKAPPLPIKGQ